MKRLKMLFAALFLMVSIAALAQNTKVKGSVTDATTGDPIPYATVQVKGTVYGLRRFLFAVGSPEDHTLVQLCRLQNC